MSSTNNLDQKSMLFGNTPMTKDKKAPKASVTPPIPSSTVSKKPHTHLSASACEKKIKEGKDLHERALKHLKTSLFQWSPDHVAAAATLEAAANCYNVAGELQTAQELFLLAADSHDAAGSAAACAQTLLKASKVSKTRGDWRATADIHQRSAQMWGVHGDPNRAGEFLLKAAKELEKENPSRAQELYLQGLGHLCPEETPEDQMSSCPAIVPEALRQCFDFYMSVRSSAPSSSEGGTDSFTVSTLDVVEFCRRMVKVFRGLEAEASKCRLLLTITLLQLEMGDVVAADRGFMDGLGDGDYLKSSESALAEDFITAYKNLDCDKMDAAQHSHHLAHLDRSVQQMARGLSLLRGHSTASSSVPTGKVASVGSSSQRVASDAIAAAGIPDSTCATETEAREEISPVEKAEGVSVSLSTLVVDEQAQEQEKDDEDDDDFDLT